MAARKGNKRSTDENTAAAHAFVVDAAGKLERHADAMKARIEELTEANYELSEQLDASESNRQKEVGSLREKLAASQAAEQKARESHEAMKRSVLTTLT